MQVFNISVAASRLKEHVSATGNLSGTPGRNHLARFRFMIAVTLGLVMLVPATAFAATYYVAQSGSDTAGNGSVSQPWASVRKAAATISGGDTVHVAAGTYAPFSIAKAGTAAAPTRFVADGAVVISGGTNGITISADYVWVSGFTITGHSGHGIFSSGHDHLVVSDCEVHHNAGTDIHSSAGVFFERGEGHLVDRCTFHDLYAGGVHLYDCANSTVSNNQIYDIEEDGVLVSGVNLSVDGNTIHGLDNNEIHSDGIVVEAPWYKTYGTTTAGIVIRDNKTYDITQHIYLTAWGAAGTLVDGVAVYNNVCFVTDTSFFQTGLSFDRSTNGISMTNVDIYNNTVANFAKAGAPGLRWGPRPVPGRYSNFEVKNNLFLNSVFSYEEAVDGLKLDHNLYYRPSGVIVEWGGARYSSLAAFRSALGYEVHGVSGDPVLTSQFLPGTGSAAAATGIGPLSDANVPGVDRSGAARSGVTASIGAYEFRGTPTGLQAQAPSVVSYRASASVSGVLQTDIGLPVREKSVELEVLTGTVWTKVASSQTDANGAFSMPSPVLTRAKVMRVAFAGDLLFHPAHSATFRVVPKARLSTPSAPKTVSRSRTYTVSGYLKPKHTSGTKPIRIRCYRKQSGKWVLRRTYLAKVSTVSSETSKYKARVRLPYAGRWRIRAYHKADTYNASTVSTYRYVISK